MPCRAKAAASAAGRRRLPRPPSVAAWAVVVALVVVGVVMLVSVPGRARLSARHAHGAGALLRRVRQSCQAAGGPGVYALRPQADLLAALAAAARAEAGRQPLRLATDLDGDGPGGGSSQPPHRPALLLPASAVRACLAPVFDLTARPEARDAWLADRETLAVVGAWRNDAAAAALSLCAHGCPGSSDEENSDARADHPRPPRLPPLFTACPPHDDLCALEALLCGSTPVLTAEHAAALVSLVGAGSSADGGLSRSAGAVAAAIAVLGEDGQIKMGYVDGDAGLATRSPPPRERRHAAPAHLAPLPPHSPAAATAALDALLDGHVPLTVHPDEDGVVDAVYIRSLGEGEASGWTATPTLDDAPPHARTLHVWAGIARAAGPYDPTNGSFVANMGDLASVPAVAAALLARTGDWAAWNASGLVPKATLALTRARQHGGSLSRPLPPPHPLVVGGVRLVSNGTATPAPCLVGVGSVLGFATAKGGPAPRLVWGSGAIDERAHTIVHGDDPAGQHVWAGVRGPRTRALLLARHGVHAPPIGDPALLLPTLLPLPPGHTPTFDLAIILHTADVAAFHAHPWSRQVRADPRVLVTHNDAPLLLGLDRVWSARRIISSALHGVILAHAYGIPVLPVRLGDALTGGEFKFRDHYHGVGHSGFVRRVPFSELVGGRVGAGRSVDGVMAAVDEYWQPARPPETGRMVAAFPLPAEVRKD
jgi:hypothetical protein